jgi:hypothetical protein
LSPKSSLIQRAATSKDTCAAPALRMARTADCAWPPPVQVSSSRSTWEPCGSRAFVLKCSGLTSRGRWTLAAAVRRTSRPGGGLRRDPAQGMLPGPGRKRRHGCPVGHRHARQRARASGVHRQSEQDQQSHDRDVLIDGSLRLVAAHHVAGLLPGYRVGQERDGIGEPFVGAVVVVARRAARVAACWCRADGAGNVVVPDWVAKVSASSGNQGCAQPRHGLLVEHAYAEANRRSSSPTAARSATS